LNLPYRAFRYLSSRQRPLCSCPSSFSSYTGSHFL
jgi:hypothetical protein